MTLFSKRLKEAMQLKNFKAADLVKKTNISKGAISSYLSGNYAPKVSNIVLLANALEVDPNWLSGIEKEEKNEYFIVPEDRGTFKKGQKITLKDLEREIKKLKAENKKLKELKNEKIKIIELINIFETNAMNLLAKIEKMNEDHIKHEITDNDFLKMRSKYLKEIKKTEIFLNDIKKRNTNYNKKIENMKSKNENQ